MRNASDKRCKGNQNTHFVVSTFFFENCEIYEIMSKTFAERERPQTKIWRMGFACRITTATSIHTQVV